MVTRRKLYGKDELSPAELAWLTGEGRDALDSWDAFDHWNLEHGFPSHHEGRRIWPDELLAQYGFLVPADRRPILDLQVTRVQRQEPEEPPRADVVPLSG